MNEFLKMDIFFVVATIAVAVVGIALCVVLVYLARFLKTLDRIANEIQEETEAIRQDLDDARHEVRRSGAQLSTLTSLFGKTAARFLGGDKKKRK